MGQSSLCARRDFYSKRRKLCMLCAPGLCWAETRPGHRVLWIRPPDSDAPQGPQLGQGTWSVRARGRPSWDGKVADPAGEGLPSWILWSPFPVFSRMARGLPAGPEPTVQTRSRSSTLTIRPSFPKRTRPALVTTPGRWAPGMGRSSPSGSRPTVLSVELKNVSFCWGPETGRWR